VTPADVIVEVRKLIQDTLAPYRYSDTDLLGYVNQVLKRVALFRPDLFGTITTVSTTANTPIQTLPSDAIRLIDIFQVVNGDAVTEVDRETLSRTLPGWMAETAGTPVNFMRHVKNPEQYFLYPKPTSGVQLLVEYAKSPVTYTIAQTITELSDAYLPLVVDGTVWLAESIDSEYVTNGRAALFQKSFADQLVATIQNRQLTDTKQAGMKPRRPQSRSDVVGGEVI
jgi:hypothetical protein